mmetsp:Transcript_6809/g.9528  ORF Transcript_6809/g.9528 Transcript_6809/m.9528 type:complete len:409 (-) Transcript_6809:34-1260(-)
MDSLSAVERNHVLGGTYRPRQLKPWSWLFLFTLPIILILMAVWYWQFAFISFLISLPSVRLYFWWYRNQEFAGPLDHLVSSYAQGFYLIFAVSNLSASLAFIATNATLRWLATVLIGNDIGGNRYLKTLIEGAAWSAWVIVEEAWKVSFASWAKRRRAHVHLNPRETKAWVSAATATAFGYATSQSILFVCVFTALFAVDDKISWTEFGWLLLYAFIFGAVAMPLSVLASYLAGLELTRATHPLLALIWPAGLRVAYVFQFFFWFTIFAKQDNLIHLFLIALSIVAVYYVTSRRIRFVESTLPINFIQNVAPLRRDFGFALLPSSENSDDNAFGISSNREFRYSKQTTEMVSVQTNPLPVLSSQCGRDYSNNPRSVTADVLFCFSNNISRDQSEDVCPVETPRDVVEL